MHSRPEVRAHVAQLGAVLVGTTKEMLDEFFRGFEEGKNEEIRRFIQDEIEKEIVQRKELGVAGEAPPPAPPLNGAADAQLIAAQMATQPATPASMGVPISESAPVQTRAGSDTELR